MNIAIIRCHKHGYSCTGAGCLKAYDTKDAAFAQYADVDTNLVASTDCCGCENFGVEEDGVANPLFAKRLTKLKDQGAEKIHLANCCSAVKCPNFKTITSMVEAAGFEYERGTHGKK